MNSKKIDVYFANKIYKDANKTDWDFAKAIGEPSIYIVLANLVSYPITKPHQFQSGEDVSGRYELGYQWQTDFKGKGKRWEDCTQAVYSMAHVGLRRIVAIPLPTPAPVASPDKETYLNNL